MYKMVLGCLSLCAKSSTATTQIKATQQYILIVLYIGLCKVILAFESVGERNPLWLTVNFEEIIAPKMKTLYPKLVDLIWSHLRRIPLLTRPRPTCFEQNISQLKPTKFHTPIPMPP